jgi:peroxiredoxin
MKQLKSIYMGVLIPALILMTLINGYGIYQNGLTIAWIGVAFAHLPLLLFFIRAAVLQNMPRTSSNLTLTTIISFIGLIMTVVALYMPEAATTYPLVTVVLAFLGNFLLILFTTWYSWLDRDVSETITRGAKLPEFFVTDKGISVNSKEFIGKPSVIIFYRGSWCPFCVAQIKEVVNSYQSAIHSGVKFILISPQADKVTRKLANKFDVPFLFLTDEKNTAAHQLGIVDKNGLPLGIGDKSSDGDTVFPTVIVTNSDSTVVYCDQTENYRFRPEPSNYLKYIQA